MATSIVEAGSARATRRAAAAGSGLPGGQGSSSFSPSLRSPRLALGSASTRTTRPRRSRTCSPITGTDWWWSRASASSTPPCFRSTCGSYTTVSCTRMPWSRGPRFLAAGRWRALCRPSRGQRHRDLRRARWEARDVRRETRPQRLLHALPVDLRRGQRRGRLRQPLRVAAGVLVFRSGVLPRWLGWVSIPPRPCSSCRPSASAG